MTIVTLSRSIMGVDGYTILNLAVDAMIKCCCEGKDLFSRHVIQSLVVTLSTSLSQQRKKRLSCSSCVAEGSRILKVIIFANTVTKR